MTHLRSPSAPVPTASRYNRLRRLSYSLVATVLLGAVLSCEQDVSAPATPDGEPALATATAAALSFRQVSIGWRHSCGVTTDDRAFCWGFNKYGQLGDGTTTDRHTPVAVVGGHRFREVSVYAQSDHTCGVTTDNLAYCWGWNFSGELGDGTTTDRHTPTAVAGGHRFRQVGPGFNHTCGVTTDDLAFCWGSNSSGALGIGRVDNDGGADGKRLTPVPVVGGRRFRQVSGGFGHTCGVNINNLAFCWGSNGSGQFGNGTTSSQPKPAGVAGGLSFREVSAGHGYSCGVTTTDRAYCWGNNFRGKLGDGTEITRLRPTAVAGGRLYRQVRTDTEHTCGVTTGNLAFCWGRNRFGEVGDGTHIRRLQPVAVAGGLRFAMLSSGAEHTCGVTTGSRAFCWGTGSNGRLGYGGTTERTRPIAVAGSM